MVGPVMPPTPTAVPWSAGPTARVERPYGAAGAVLAALLLATADMSVMSTLLPLIAESFGGGDTSVPWLISLFMSSMAFSGLAVGTLADRYGLREVLSVALVLFAGAALLGALSPDLRVLMVARALEGIGAGGILVLAYSSLASLFGAERHALVQTLIGLTWGFSAVVSPMAGLALAHAYGWRSVLVADVALALVCIPILQRQRFRVPSTRRGELDGAAQGAFAVFILALMLTLALFRAGESAARLAAATGVCAVALTILVLRARKRPEACPVPLDFFLDRRLAALTAIVPCASGGLYASVTFVPLAVGARSDGALAVTSAGLGFVAASTTCGWLLRRWGFRAIAASGALSMAGGSLWLGQGVATLPAWEIATAEGAIGIGLGCVAVSSVVYAQCVARPGYLATHTSAIQVLRNVGAAIGISAFPLLHGVLRSAPTKDATSHGFLVLSGVMGACAALACVLPPQPPTAPSDSVTRQLGTAPHRESTNENGI